MMEEVLDLLTKIYNACNVSAIFLFFMFILVLGYFIGSLADECIKRNEQKKKEENKTLKEEIVNDITSYYESTKENEK